ncbi:MAG: cation:proton antiporter [Ktedonobacterales bacterium]
MDEALQTTIETLLMLLLVICIVALIVERVRLPYTVALVVIGLLGFQPDFRHIHLTPNLILEVFLPVLLFEGAYNVNARRLAHEALPVTLLAVPGVLIATLVTALLFGNYGSTSGLNPQSVHAISATWKFLGFVANSLVFLLIGIELDPLTIARNGWIIGVAFLAALAGRGVVVYLLALLLHGRHWTIPPRFAPVLLWGGLRGAVSLALVLSLPFTLPGGQPFPDRNLLQLLTFGVVGASLLLQGLTMGPLIRRLRLTSDQAQGDRTAPLEARLAATEGALLALAREHDHGAISTLEYDRLCNAYQLEDTQIRQQLDQAEETEETEETEAAQAEEQQSHHR